MEDQVDVRIWSFISLFMAIVFFIWLLVSHGIFICRSLCEKCLTCPRNEDNSRSYICPCFGCHKTDGNNTNTTVLTYNHETGHALPIPTVSAAYDLPPPYKAVTLLDYGRKCPR